VAFSFHFAGPPEAFAVEASLGLAPGHYDSGLAGVVATKLRIDHRQLDVSKNGGAKNYQLPALRSGNAGSWILPRISEFDQLSVQVFLLVFSRDATPQAL
jgi:hypothetical protein